MSITNINLLVEKLIETAKKKHNLTGVPFYRVDVQTILDSGFSLKTLRSNAKAMGARMVENENKVSFSSYNLRCDLLQLLKESV